MFGAVAAIHRLPNLPPVIRYALAAGSVGLAWGVKLITDPAVPTDRPLFLWFLAAAVVSACYGGFGPGIFATLLSSIVADYFLFIPHYDLSDRNGGQYLQIAVFVGIGVFTSAFCGEVRTSRQRLAAALASPESVHDGGSSPSLEERARLTRLEGEIGRTISRADTLHDMLQGCVDALVKHAGAAFARVWTFDARENVLILQAEAGKDTRANAAQQRVPVGHGKIGRIAAEKAPYVTNQVVGDPRVEDQEWAQRERMSAFAGYPLLVGGELQGVLGMFARERISDGTPATLALLANTIALAIHQRETDRERTRLLQETVAARETAERASRAKDEFIAVVSHELRTPLTAILGWARLMASGDLNPAETVEAVAVIQRNALSQSQLVEDLLDVSRIISGKLRLDLRAADLPAVVQEAVRTIHPTADSKGVRLEITVDPRAGPVSGDPDRLRQIVWNLLSNAVKFTPKKGKVQVRLSRVNSHVELCVCDTGVGIEPEFLPRVFERFTQADSSSTRAHSGLGLGLGIARHLVELHGGTISADSDGKDQGATFRMTLPIMIVHGAADRPQGAHPTAPAAAAKTDGPASGGLPFHGAGELAGVRVVAVDDDADARKLLHTVLTRCHAQVTVVGTAAEALEAVRRERPDVLLSDVEMGGEDGYTLIGKVRALPPEEGGRTPAAALTAYARVEDRTRALRAGFQMHVPKPVEPSELVAVVANLAGRSGPNKVRSADNGNDVTSL